MRFLFCLFISAFAVSAAVPREVISNILGIEAGLAAEYTQALESVSGPDVDFGPYSEPVTDFCARGVLNELPAVRAVRTVPALVEALADGAPLDDALDIAEIGFTEFITADQIQSACAARRWGRQFNLDIAIVDEVILDCVVEQRSGAAIEGIVLGIEKGIRSGIRQDKCAVALLVRFAQGTKGKSIKEVVDEEIAFIKSNRSADEAKVDSMMDTLEQSGISGSLLRELSSYAMEQQWPDSVTMGVLQALQTAHEKNLTIEKVLLASVIRIAQGIDKPLAAALDEEIVVIASQKHERKRMQAVQNSPALRTGRAAVKMRLAQSKKSGPSRNDAAAINRAVLENSINSFLHARAPRTPPSTPYKWGGETRSGVDCSGFTSVCFKESGITIPRVSRHQYAHFKKKGRTLKRSQLRYGDLVFFSSNGRGGRITHVGIYYKKNQNGDDIFVHSSCTPGVNICNLSKNRYWGPRYVGAVRVVQ